MSLDHLLFAIDGEITRLQQARALLAGTSTASRDGKPAAPSERRVRRRLSAEARARIAEAQRKRWAAQKKAATK